MLDKILSLKAVLASFLVTQWLVLLVAGDDGCLWCNNGKVTRFTHCMFIEIMNDSEFDVLPSNILLDMKSSLFAASSGMKRSPDHMKMQIMNGALAGIMAEMIASYYTGQSSAVAVDEMMKITGYCYRSVTGQTPALFVGNIKRLVDDVIQAIGQYDSDETDPVYGSVGSNNHYNQIMDQPNKSFSTDGISDRPGVKQPQQVANSGEISYTNASPPPINNGFSKQSMLYPQQKTGAASPPFPNKNLNRESLSPGMPKVYEKLPANPSPSNKFSASSLPNGHPPSAGMRQVYGPKQGNRPLQSNELSAPLFPNKNMNGEPLSLEIPEFYEKKPSNPPPSSNTFTLPSLQNRNLDDQPAPPGMPQAYKTNPANRPLPSREFQAPSLQIKNLKSRSLSPEIPESDEVGPSNTPRQDNKAPFASNHRLSNNPPPPARPQIYETKSVNPHFSSGEHNLKTKNTMPQISSKKVENPNSRNQYHQTGQDNFESSNTAPVLNNQSPGHRVPNPSKIKNSAFSNQNFYQNNPTLEYENFNDAYPVHEAYLDKQSVDYNDYNNFDTSDTDINNRPERYRNFPVFTNDNPQLNFNAPNSDQYGDSFSEKSYSQPNRNFLPSASSFMNPNEFEQPQFVHGYSRPSSIQDSSVPGSSNNYDSQRYDKWQQHQSNANYFAPPSIIPSVVPDIASDYDTGQQFNPDLQEDISAMGQSSSPTQGQNQFGIPWRSQQSREGIKSELIASESGGNPDEWKPASKKSVLQQQGVGNANEMSTACAVEFSDTLFDQLLKSNVFHSIFGTETLPSLAKQIASEALKRAFIDNGKDEYAEEVAMYCSQQFESLSDVSSTEEYAEKISKSAMVVLYRTDLLSENCENIARSMTLDILRWLKVISDDLCLDSSAEETTGAADSSFSSNSSPAAPISSNSSPNADSDHADTIQPGNIRDSSAGPTSTKSLPEYETEDEYCDEESSEYCYEESSDSSIEDNQSDEKYEEYDSSEEDQDDGSLNSSFGTSIIPNYPEESNPYLQREDNQVIKESELSDSESKRQIEILMASAEDSISFNGLFDYEHFATAMSSVASDMRETHSDWNNEKIFMKAYLQAVVALTQVLQKISISSFSTQIP